MFRLIWERAVGRTRVYRVYTTKPNQRIERDGAVRAYDREHPPPRNLVALYRRTEGLLATEVMLCRLHHHGAVLLAMVTDAELAAYGWLQCWGPLRREFWWLADDAICLGPYWTDESQSPWPGSLRAVAGTRPGGVRGAVSRERRLHLGGT